MSKASSEHQFYLDMPFEIRYGLKNFDSDEKAILHQYGSWFRALMAEWILPENNEQKHFVLVCQGKATPENKHEYIWKKWIGARDQANAPLQTLSTHQSIAPSVSSRFHLPPPYAGPISPYYAPPKRPPSKIKIPENLLDHVQPNSLIKRHSAVNKAPITSAISEESNKETSSTDESYSRSICPVCGGDGGGGGRCYKCDGTGWVK